MSTFQTGNDFDWTLTTDGKLTLETDPLFCAAIKLRNRFFFFLGEWFLDTREGVPYFQIVLVKNPNLEVIKRLFTSLILSVSPVIVTVSKMDVYLLGPTRELVVEFEAFGADGRRLEGGTGKPFVIEGVEIDGATVEA